MIRDCAGFTIDGATKSTQYGYIDRGKELHVLDVPKSRSTSDHFAYPGMADVIAMAEPALCCPPRFVVSEAIIAGNSYT